MIQNYDFKYIETTAVETVVERRLLPSDRRAAIEAMEQLIRDPRRYAVEVWRDGNPVFSRTRRSF